MKVLVLAAGRSKRMQPVRDKNFLEFLGRPLIVHQLELINAAGLNDVVLVGGEHNLAELQEVTSGMGMNIEMVQQEDLDMGMCGAVLSSKDKIIGEEVIVFSSNDVVDQKAFNLVLEAAKTDDATSYMIGKKVEEYFPGGYLETDSDGFISSIVEKPGEGNEPSDLVNLVVHLHRDTEGLVKALEEASSEGDDLYEVALDNMMKAGVKMKAVSYDGVWLPIKFPWHVQAVFNYLFEKADKGVAESAQISDKATVKGDVIIEEGVRIFEGAIVNGPAYLGKNVIVANNALVRDSHLGEGCVAGFSTEIARSFLGSDVWTHSNYIGDSVIGNNVSFGAGTVTGNLRLDEGNIVVKIGDGQFDTKTNKFGLTTGDNIRVGINTSFMPGIKIGSGSFIGAGITVALDIPEKSFVRGHNDLKISPNTASLDDSRDEMRKNLK